MRALIVRKPRSRRISDRIAYAKLVAESLKDNPYFPTPVPALARLVDHIAAAEAAHRFRARTPEGLRDWSRVLSRKVSQSKSRSPMDCDFYR